MKKLILSLVAFGALVSSIFGAADTFRVVRSGKHQKVNSVFMTDLNVEGIQYFDVSTLTADDVTPDVSGGSIFELPANTGATAITDLDNPVVGQLIYFIGTSATNSATIADSGNFALSAAWTASPDDVLVIYVQADNDYIEIGRVDN